MSELADWQTRIGRNNREKGWHDDAQPDDPNWLAAKLMLIVSEAAEALEDVRAGQLTTYASAPDGKPCGLPSELADIIIRTLDLAELLGIDMESEMRLKHSFNRTRPHRHGGKRL